MTNIVRFPNGRKLPLPPGKSHEALLEDLAATEVRIAELHLAQMQTEFRYMQTMFAWHCFKRCLFWGLLLWIISRFM